MKKMRIWRTIGFLCFGPSLWFLTLDTAIVEIGRIQRSYGIPSILVWMVLASWAVIHWCAIWIMLFQPQLLLFRSFFTKPQEEAISVAPRYRRILANGIVLVFVLVMLALILVMSRTW